MQPPPLLPCMWNASEQHFFLLFFWPLSQPWVKSRMRSQVGSGPGASTRLARKRQDYVSGISHGGAVPKVQGSGRREREKPSLQWHLDLDSVSWINRSTTVQGKNAEAVRRIQSREVFLSRGPDRDKRCSSVTFKSATPHQIYQFSPAGDCPGSPSVAPALM